mgnify:CR=1 FL=1
MSDNTRQSEDHVGSLKSISQGSSNMKTATFFFIVIATVMVMTCQTFGGQGERFKLPKGPASQALQVLATALKGPAGAEAADELLVAAAKEALQVLPEQSPVAEQLNRAISLRQESGNPEDTRQVIAEVSSSLSFQPQKEADLPKGFPSFTPVGVVEIKEYPACRKAVAGQFWTLFRHIQSNNISMTTPVEMKYDPDQSGALSRQSMAFLYANVGLGEVGKKGEVNVVDVQPLTVVAIGVRGSRNQKTVDRAHQYLTRYIDAQSDWVASGSPRVMGYNSPMVRRANRFFEVQVLVRKLHTELSE